jgi:hypothetical protein
LQNAINSSFNFNNPSAENSSGGYLALNIPEQATPGLDDAEKHRHKIFKLQCNHLLEHLQFAKMPSCFLLHTQDI